MLSGIASAARLVQRAPTMRILILLIAGLWIGDDVAADTFAKRVATAKIQCSTELGLKAEFIIEFSQQQIYPETNKNYNGYYGCFLKRMGLQDASSGNFNYDRFVDILSQVLVDKFEDDPNAEWRAGVEARSIVDKCKSVPKGTTHGHSAVKLHNCLMGSDLFSFSL